MDNINCEYDTDEQLSERVELFYEKQEDIQSYQSEITIEAESADSTKAEWAIQSKEAAGDIETSVFDVAAYILKRCGTMTTMKLQKLVYYCQAWSLVWDEKPLFKEAIEAWANGPVVRDLFSYHSGQYYIDSILVGNPDLLNSEQKETINAVLDFYGDKSSQWLIDLTHKEDPWNKARGGIPISRRSNRIIKYQDMADYYSSL